jgi:uncharacterized damage-inducible protein DinB
MELFERDIEAGKVKEEELKKMQSEQETTISDLRVRLMAAEEVVEAHSRGLEKSELERSVSSYLS